VSLAEGLVAYSSRMIKEAPKWVEEFQFANESSIKNKIEVFKKETLIPLENELHRYGELKSILWMGDNYLRDAVNEFLRIMGLSTEVQDKGEEDLWILDDNERKIVVEVKSKNKNLERIDVTKLDEHREAREVQHLTGLLVANTFMTAASINDKDQRPPPNVIEKALGMNVVITRTIDLCRIYDHFQKTGNDEGKMLLKSIDGQKGWLTYKDNSVQIVTK
jgi:hypothetical protein